MKFDISVIKEQNIIFLTANAIAVICTILVIFAICYDFIQYHQPKKNKKKVNSWVETGSMFVYFFVYLLLIKSALGRITVPSELLQEISCSIAIILLIAGCYINIKGRVILNHNWANQVTIYHNHTLVTQSVYGWVRHPLYASLIWMLIGGSLIYASYLAFGSVLFIFIPMMYHRAKQEETLLKTEFPDYSQYIKRVGMFFPKLVPMFEIGNTS